MVVEDMVRDLDTFCTIMLQLPIAMLALHVAPATRSNGRAALRIPSHAHLFMNEQSFRRAEVWSSETATLTEVINVRYALAEPDEQDDSSSPNPMLRANAGCWPVG